MTHKFAGTALILFALTWPSFLLAKAQPRAGKGPIEIKSDPYGVGNPTHYSILRGTTKVTFSHPLAGQFSRAEVSTLDKNGTNLTRFLLSPDGKTYRPVLRLETPFEKHYSTSDMFCPDPANPTPLKMVENLKPEVEVSEIIAKKRDELAKAGFFDASCFDPSIKEEHRDAIMNAAADVLTPDTQDASPEPKFLRCLEKYGFAHESGIIQALVKQSITDSKTNPRVRLACTTDKKAKPAEFNEQTRLITLKITPKPSRLDYAIKGFHELLHASPIRDSSPLQAMEECCAMGEQCEILKAYGEQRKSGDKKVAVLETVDQKNTVATGTLTALKGIDAESMGLAKPSEAVKDFESSPFGEQTLPPACLAAGEKTCQTVNLKNEEYLLSFLEQKTCRPRKAWNTRKNKFISNLIMESAVAIDLDYKKTCIDPNSDFSLTAEHRVNEIIANNADKTLAQLGETIPQTSPIDWGPTPSETESPSQEQAVPIRMAARTPTRTIASIAPLPDEKPQQSLGSARNRADVSKGRATLLVDTMEAAATKVATTLTSEKLELLSVDRNQLFASDFKPKTGKPHYIVTASADKPIKVADIGDVQGLGFPNPFEHIKAKTADGKSISPGSTIGKPTENNKEDLGTKTEKAKISGSNADRSGDPSQGNPFSAASNGAHAKAVDSPSSTRAGGLASSKNHGSEMANSHAFKSMDRGALVRFITSSFRSVSSELENSEFAEALVKNGIQIVDHENRRIGSMKPDTTFVYRSDVGRLVQTRIDREKK